MNVSLYTFMTQLDWNLPYMIDIILVLQMMLDYKLFEGKIMSKFNRPCNRLCKKVCKALISAVVLNLLLFSDS
jgi:hypothetical protein